MCCFVYDSYLIHYINSPLYALAKYWRTKQIYFDTIYFPTCNYKFKKNRDGFYLLENLQLD